MFTKFKYGIAAAFVVFVLIGLTACQDTKSKADDLQDKSIDSLSTYGRSQFRFPDISPQASDIVAQWAVFSDFQLEATDLNNRSRKDIVNKTERIIAHTDSLRKSMPDTLKTLPIYSRLVVAGTRARLLNQEASKDSADSLKIEQALRQMNQATVSLINQINEKFQKDRIDAQRRDDELKELEKQKRFVDSVELLELADQKRIKPVTNR